MEQDEQRDHQEEAANLAELEAERLAGVAEAEEAAPAGPDLTDPANAWAEVPGAGEQEPEPEGAPAQDDPEARLTELATRCNGVSLERDVYAEALRRLWHGAPPKARAIIDQALATGAAHTAHLTDA